jgi:hypothetical protein
MNHQCAESARVFAGVQLDPVACGAQYFVRDSDDNRIFHQRRDMTAAAQEAAKALGPLAIESALAKRRRLEDGREIPFQRLERARGRR